VRVQLIWQAVIVAALGLSGCGQPPEASFAVNQEKVGPLLRDARAEVAGVLKENFGTPVRLVAWEKFPVDYGKADPKADSKSARSKDGWRLVEGRNLYMTHCVHCHGVAGDGNGPTAHFLNPRPRDYRQGTFKFKSTKRAVKPSHADLLRILEQGIPGTYMPSFVLLGEEKLGLIIDYVRWLSIRGNLELRLATELAALGATDRDVAQAVADDETKALTSKAATEAAMKSVKDELPGLLNDISTSLAEDWTAADDPESIIVPKVKRGAPDQAAIHESIERGRKLFLSQVQGKKTECAECHGLTGRGDGPNTEKYWPIPNTTPERKYEVAGLHDDWGHPQQPRNLTRGIYRGGRRPIDIFRRVHEGIPGTQMAGFAAVLTHDEIWDIVNFVLSVPFEGKHTAYPAEINGEQNEKKVAAKED